MGIFDLENEVDELIRRRQSFVGPPQPPVSANAQLESNVQLLIDQRRAQVAQDKLRTDAEAEQAFSRQAKFTDTSRLASIPESSTAQAAREQELRTIVETASQKFGARTIDDFPTDGEGLQARLAAGELRKIYGMRDPEPNVSVISERFGRSSPELEAAAARVHNAPAGGPRAPEEFFERQQAEMELARLLDDGTGFDPGVTLAKSALGAIPEQVARIGQYFGPGTENVAEALYGPGAGQVAREQLDEASQGTLGSRFAEAVAISPEEEAQNPLARLGGSLAGNLPLAAIGPAASVGGLVEGQGMKALASRIGLRGMATASEMAPQVVAEAALGIDSGQLTPAEAAELVATQVGIGFAAGGALEGAGLRGVDRAPSGGVGIRGARRISLQDAKALLDAGVPEAEVRAALTAPNEPARAAQAPRNLDPNDPQIAAARVQEALGEQADIPDIRRPTPDLQGKTIDDMLADTEARLALEEQIRAMEVAAENQFHALEASTPSGAARDVEEALAGRGSVAQVEEPPSVAGTMGARNVPEPPTRGPRTIGEFRVVKGEGQVLELHGPGGSKMEVMPDGQGNLVLLDIRKNQAESARPILEAAEELASQQGLRFARGKTTATAEGQASLQSAVDKGFVREDPESGLFVSTRKPDVAGGGLPAQPLPNPVPKVINENLNTERLNVSQEALQEMYTSGRIHGLDIHLARGPRRPHTEVLAESQNLLSSPERVNQLLSKPLGSSHTDVEGFALRQLYANRAQNMHDVSEGLGKGTHTAEDLAKAMDQFLDLERRRTSAAAEAGRGLSAFQMLADGQVPPDVFEQLAKYVQATGQDPGVLASLMRKINPNTLKKFSGTQRLTNALHEWWIQSLVSSSHAVNIGSNLAELGLDVGRRATAAALDIGGGKDRVRFGEVGAALPRIIGVKQGLRNAWQFLKTGIPQHAATATQKIQGQSALPKPLSPIQFVGTRALGAEDEVFSLLGYSGETAALAYRKAASEGLSGQAMQTRITQILNDVAAGKEGAIHSAGIRRAERSTFRDPTAIGRAAGSLANADVGRIAGLGISFRPMRWVIPFTRVGSSIFTSTIEHSPLGFVTVPIRRKIGQPTGRRLAEDLARPVLGTMLGLTGMALRESGHLTGDRRPNKAERDLLYSQGWQPNSLKIGNKFFSVERFEPVGSILLFTANAVDMFNQNRDEEGNHFLDSAVQATKGMASDTWFKSIDDLMSILDSNDSEAAERYAANLAAGFVPNIARRALKETGDTTIRQSKGFVDQLGQQIGLSAGEPRLDAFGREQGAERPLIDRISRFFGVPASTAKADPVIQEHMRLGIAIAPLGSPQDTDEEGKVIFQGLSEAEQLRFANDKGEFLYDVTKRVMDSPKYKRKTDEEKAQVLQAVRSIGSAAYHRAWRDDPKNPGAKAKRIIRQSIRTTRKPTAIDEERFAREVELFEGLR